MRVRADFWSLQAMHTGERIPPASADSAHGAGLGFNDLIGFLVAWNLWLFAILNTSEIGL